MITATMTRPTTIAPTLSCERKIAFQEDIDIATLGKPRPQYISLEPIARRSRSRRVPAIEQTPQTETQEQQQAESGAERQSASEGSTTGNAESETEPPQSPSPSDMSFGSEPSTGSIVDSNSVSVRTADSKAVGEFKPHSHARRHRSLKPITASIQLQQAGFLRGDNILVKINVQHTKQIKSIHGVIVTLYRMARVDTQASIPKAIAKVDTSDSLTRPRSNLRAFSFGGIGSTHTFRKDLSQSFASLMINPNTLKAEVKATVSVPESAFPTISSVPGGVISFKYYIEVVLDLQGKLAGLSRFLPNAGMTGVSTHNEDGSIGMPSDLNQNIAAQWGGHFIDTEEIRREKSVVISTFEVVVGNKDSNRKGKWRSDLPAPDLDNVDFSKIGNFDDASRDGNESPTLSYSRQLTTGNELAPAFEFVPPDTPPPPIHAIPIPDLTAEEQNMTEKELLRRREEQLLPSQPPEAVTEGSSADGQHAPSAPILGDDVPPFPAADGPSAPQMDDLYGLDGPSAPAYHDDGSSSAQLAPDAATDDKLELQRRRLELERSAPPLEAEQAVYSTAVGPSAPPSAPSNPSAGDGGARPCAPTIEDISLGFSRATVHDPHLPPYER